MNIVFGAGGVALEVAWLLRKTNGSKNSSSLTPDLFITEDTQWSPNQSIDGIPVIRECELLASPPEVHINAYVAVGQPTIKRKILSKIQHKLGCEFPNITHSLASRDYWDGDIRLGKGVIVYPNASLTIDISVGDFVHINPCANVAHGVQIGDFSTLCPGSTVCGNVVIGEACFIGAGVIIKDGVRIANECTIGAGTVVVADITESGTWVGVPARRLRE